jgi:predicted Rossmann fold flavoprotein
MILLRWFSGNLYFSKMYVRPVLVVIGGGAAGFFCAVNAAARASGLRVILLEKTDKLLSKVRVSGGGRCNVTHACEDIREMSGRYPRGQHFVRKAFHQFFTTDTIEWFRQRGVQLKTEADGRMFPESDRSATIVDCLLKEAGKSGVEIRTKQQVVSVQKAADGSGFVVDMEGGMDIQANFVCVAVGGYPKESQYHWIQALGHSFEPPVPSLFTLNAPGHPICALMGLSVPDVELSFQHTKLRERGPVLVTHWGLSGPAVLRLSAWGARELARLDYTGNAVVHWLPSLRIDALRSQLQIFRDSLSQQVIAAKSPFTLPLRLWVFILQQSGIHAELRWQAVSNKMLNRLAEQLCHFILPVKGKTTFKEEFVTAGGVSTSEVNPMTMESRKQAGLYFAGEILDVDGITGGYNFQHAWTSGYNAAVSIASVVAGHEANS